MKIELITKKGDIKLELKTSEERLTFAKTLEDELSESDFISADLIEAEGIARFSSAAGFIRALKNYED